MTVSRIKEIDFLKCVYILLMIIFHLAYFSDLHPYAHKIVYTFHMPAFLIISGYFMKINRSVKDFMRIMVWFAIPYAIMEICYIGASAFLPVRGATPAYELSVSFFLNKIFLNPVGPYWFFHTLIVCSIIYYFVFLLTKQLKINLASKLIIIGLLYFIVWKLIPSINFFNSMYFLIGLGIAQSKIDFRKVFYASWFAIIPFVIFCFFPTSLDRNTLAGVIITWLSISILLSMYKVIPEKVLSKAIFIGANTLPVYLFSPIFTMLSKPLIPVFSFDPSGLLFMLTALTISVSGSLAIAKMMDILHVSRFFLGKEKIIRQTA